MLTSTNTTFDFDVNHNEEFKLNPLTYQDGSVLDINVPAMDFEDMNYYDTNVMWDIAKVARKLQIYVSHHPIDLSTVLIPIDGSLEESFASQGKLEIYIDHMGVNFIIAKYICPNDTLTEMMNHVITDYTSDSEDKRKEATQTNYTIEQMIEWAEQEHLEYEETKEV
ncbi:hypothetical protein Tco_0620741 [Tanacetum coccineum]